MKRPAHSLPRGGLSQKNTVMALRYCRLTATRSCAPHVLSTRIVHRLAAGRSPRPADNLPPVDLYFGRNRLPIVPYLLV